MKNQEELLGNKEDEGRRLHVNASIVSELYNKELEERGLDGKENEVEKFWGINFSISELNDAMVEFKKKGRKKEIGISNIESIPHNLVSENFFFDLEYNATDKRISSYDSTGVFKVEMSNGDFLFLAQWASGEGKETVADAIIVASMDVYSKFRAALKRQDKFKTRLKKGVFRIRENKGVLSYEEIKKLQQTPVIHPEKDRAESQLANFFKNIEHFTSNGRSGTRKSIWIGPPGTGKTSLSRKILRTYGKDMTVCITTSLSACYLHMLKAAKSKKPTIIVLEDAEISLSRPSSEVLNVLDGIDLPINPAGTYVIMTTNKPNMIEKRILKRPGRIDEWCFFGSLKGSDALDCAKFYFSTSLYKDLLEVVVDGDEKVIRTVKGKEKEVSAIDKDLLPLVSNGTKGMSGAQISGLADSMISFSLSKNKEISVALINEAKNEMEGYLKRIDSLIEEEGMLKEDNLGFNLNEDEDEDEGY